MDGKHIEIKQPKNSGSYYFKCKGRFSIALLALVDANYKFIYVDVSCNGRISHGGVFPNSTLSKAISTNLLNIPGPSALDDGETEALYVIVADDAFPLMENFMKTYPFRGLSKKQRIYNYHLSRAKCIVKDVFGILANCFRIFLSPILLSPENVEILTLTHVAPYTISFVINLHCATHLEVLMLKTSGKGSCNMATRDWV